MTDLQKQLQENQKEQFDQNMAVSTLFGNITHWRTNFRSNAQAMPKVLVGRMKILNLLARFKA